MMQLPQDEVSISNKSLLVFIDDTGHETFAGNQDYYGLGGCVILGAAYECLKRRWGEVRQRLTGSPDTPLHASDMQLRTSASFAVLRSFFLDRSFARMAVTSTAHTRLPANMLAAVPVFAKLQEYLAEAAACIPCDEVVIIVEASQRADPLLREHFSKLLPVGSVAVPTRHWFMPKAAKEPGLEVADFIVSAAKSETRRYMKDATEFAPDFADVFRQTPLADRWFSIVTAGQSDAEGVAITVQRLPR
jgi:hypothetical protein